MKSREKKPGFVVVLDRCIGCMACVAACNTEWKIPMGKENWRTDVLKIEDHILGNPKVTYLPVLCNQCDNPPCVEVCPTGASYKREKDGIVLVDTDMCIGCKACMIACPYDARYYNEAIGAVDKCTWCLPRTSNGLDPACVATCVGESRNFGDLNNPNSKVSKLLKNATTVRKLQEAKGTKPAVYYITINQ